MKFTMFEGKMVPIASLTVEQLRSTIPSGTGHVRVPDAVIQAIHDVLEAVRGKTPPPAR
jgi:hypothetical protein